MVLFRIRWEKSVTERHKILLCQLSPSDTKHVMISMLEKWKMSSSKNPTSSALSTKLFSALKMHFISIILISILFLLAFVKMMFLATSLLQFFAQKHLWGWIKVTLDLWFLSCPCKMMSCSLWLASAWLLLCNGMLLETLALDGVWICLYYMSLVNSVKFFSSLELNLLYLQSKNNHTVFFPGWIQI